MNNNGIIQGLTRKDLHRVYQQVASETSTPYEAVMTLDSGIEGPEVGVMACTHGNEPSGLAAFAYLMKTPPPTGRVHLIINNVEAARRYFEEAEDLSFTAHYRFVDRDMNRVRPDDDTYEASRIRALLPLYEQLDVVIDLHSTSSPSEPMLIEVSEDLPLLNIQGVEVVLRNLVPHLNAPPLVSLCKNARAYVLETGSHEDPRSSEIAQRAVQSLLSQDLLQQDAQSVPASVYRIYQTVVFPHESYSLTRILNNLEFLPAGTLLATSDADGHPSLIVDRDAYAVMPSPRLKPVHSGSEFLYLAEKVSAGVT